MLRKSFQGCPQEQEAPLPKTKSRTEQKIYSKICPETRIDRTFQEGFLKPGAGQVGYLAGMDPGSPGRSAPPVRAHESSLKLGLGELALSRAVQALIAKLRTDNCSVSKVELHTSSAL